MTFPPRCAPLAALLLLALAACGGSSPDAKSSQSAPSASSASPAASSPPAASAPPVADAPPADTEHLKIVLLSPGDPPRRALRYVFHPPERETLTMDMRMTLQMSVDGRSMPKRAMPAVRSTMLIEAAQVLPNGDLSLGYSVTASDVMAGADDAPEIVAALRPKMQDLVGMSGQTEMTPRGGVVRATVTPPPNMDPKIADMVGQIADAMRDIQVPLPEEAVGVGARWTATSVIPLRSFSAERKATYTLVALESDKLSVDVDVALGAKPQMMDARGLPAGATAMLESMKMGGKGHTALDLGSLVPTSTVKIDGVTRTATTLGVRVQQMNIGMILQIDVAPLK